MSKRTKVILFCILILAVTTIACGGITGEEDTINGLLRGYVAP